MNELAGKHIVLGLTGGIACYKAAELCRQLIKEGATVQVVMTEAAEQFITPVTMQALSGRPVYGSQWDAREPNNMAHINLSREADAILIAPVQRRFHRPSWCRAGPTTCSACCAWRAPERVPLLLAPAMNREMWAHPATQRNWPRCGRRRHGAGPWATATRPAAKPATAACWSRGAAGRADRLLSAQGAGGRTRCWSRRPHLRGHRPGARHHQPSSGKMGFAIARAAREAGAEVTLVAGPVHLPTPRGVRASMCNLRKICSSRAAKAQQHDCFHSHCGRGRLAPGHAVRPEDQEGRLGPDARRCVLSRTPTSWPRGAVAPRPVWALYCVGFAAESHDLLAHATAKRCARACRCWWATSAPPPSGRTTTRCCW
jgi:phosphopantothenoylcysteine decarboxylase/phosphopantothenate--cysteine ligase